MHEFETDVTHWFVSQTSKDQNRSDLLMITITCRIEYEKQGLIQQDKELQ
jgi:hypothetical protein